MLVVLVSVRVLAFVGGASIGVVVVVVFCLCLGCLYIVVLGCVLTITQTEEPIETTKQHNRNEKRAHPHSTIPTPIPPTHKHTRVSAKNKAHQN